MTATGERWDVIVVGAGLGGLSCAGLLSRKGKKVLVLEKHNKVGGYAHQFKRKAGPDITYRFDVALHVTGAMDEGASSRRILEEIGVWDRIEVRRLDELFRASFPDFEIRVPADGEKFRRVLIDRFPEETDSINSLFGTIDAFAKVPPGLLGDLPGEIEAVIIHG